MHIPHYSSEGGDWASRTSSWRRTKPGLNSSIPAPVSSSSTSPLCPLSVSPSPASYYLILAPPPPPLSLSLLLLLQLKNKAYKQQHILQGLGVHGGSGVVGVHVVGPALKQLAINQEVSSHSFSSSLFQEKNSCQSEMKTHFFCSLSRVE